MNLYRVDPSDAMTMLSQLEGRLQTMRPFWTKVTAIARRAFARNFQQGGIPPWAPLRPSTIARKQRLGMPGNLKTPGGRVPRRLMQLGSLGPETILVMSGSGRDSLVQRGAPGNITEITDDGAFAGTSKPYMGYHETGTKRMVARPFLTLQESDIQEIETAALDYLFGGGASQAFGEAA